MAFIEMDFASGSGATIDKLWENPSPTSSFSAQTISSSSSGWVSGKSITDYNYFIIVTRSSTTADYKQRTATIVKYNNTNPIAFSHTSSGADTLRRLTVDSSGFSFTNCIYGSSTTGTGYTIPLYILGIKGIDGIGNYIS